MLKHLINFYKVSSDKPCTDLSVSACQRRLKRLQWSTFLAATLGYGMYYVCRLSLNVVKKPIVEEGIFSETELGIIGSVLFFTYAIGKFTNGFLADRSNINRFMTTGLLVTALVNLCLGFVHSFILFAILWGISGWFQSMGAASCVVGLSRWFTDKQRGSFYGFWSASHNIGEAMTFIIIASIVSAFGWWYGFFGAGLVGLAGALIAWRFFHDTPQSKGLPIVDLDKPGAEEQIETFVKEMSPVAFELLYVKDSNPLPKKLATTLADRSLIWYNTLWDTMAGGHDDDMSLQNPDEGYGYLIDTLGCRILQTDRPAYLLEYLRTKKMHE